MALSTEFKNNFPTALKTARKSRGLSQEDFSVVSSRTYVSTLERGLKSPTLNKVDDYSKTLGIHPLTLLALAYLKDKQPASVRKLMEQTVKELREILGHPV